MQSISHLCHHAHPCVMPSSLYPLLQSPVQGCSSMGMPCSPCWGSDSLCLKVELTSYPAWLRSFLSFLSSEDTNSMLWAAMPHPLLILRCGCLHLLEVGLSNTFRTELFRKGKQGKKMEKKGRGRRREIVDLFLTFYQYSQRH